MNNQTLLSQAQSGDINAFQELFVQFQDQLKSYLFRMTANRADAEDLAHDAFIRAFDRLNSFKQNSTLKTWVFQIATNLAYNLLQKRGRWTHDVSQQAKALVGANPDLATRQERINQIDPQGGYEIKEHIDTCFTCVSKVLPIDSQVAVLLKDIYDFSVSEIMSIMGRTEGQVKHLLQSGRQVLTRTFEAKCALVNKQGTCHQCSELNGWFNPKQDQQEARLKLKLARNPESKSSDQLYELRTQLVKGVDPLNTTGHSLQEALLNCNRMVMNEIPIA